MQPVGAAVTIGKNCVDASSREVVEPVDSISDVFCHEERQVRLAVPSCVNIMKKIATKPCKTHSSKKKEQYGNSLMPPR